MSAAVKAQIIITFRRDALNGESLSFDRTNTALVGDITMKSTFVTTGRIKNGEIPLTANTGTDGEAEAIGYERYFNLDFNTAKLMTLTRLVNVITIDINVPWNLENFTTTNDPVTSITDFVTRVETDGGSVESSACIDGLSIPSATSSRRSYTPDAFQLTSAALAIHPTTPCDTVDVDILTSEQATGYSLQYGSGLSQTDVIAVSTNPFTVTIDRLMPTAVFIHKTGSASINVSLEQWNEPRFYFNKIGNNNVNIHIIPNAFSGATINVNVNYLTQLTPRPDVNTLTYSLDGVNYGTTPTWSGQVGGNYTVYVKDSLGCVFQKAFVVPAGIESRSAVFEISERNSLTFSKNEVWDGLQDGIHKNQDNVLALTDIQDFLYDERVILRDTDNIRIQFKSNYTDHNISVLNCEDGATGYTPTVEKMSNNLDQFESLDCTLHSINPYTSRAGIYFTTGNRYNEAGTDIGDYELFGNLPDSAIVGNFIDLGATYGVREVIDLIYDRDLDKRLMVFNMVYSSDTDIDITMKSYFDLLPFEVYEFNLAIGSPILKPEDNSFRVKIQCLHNAYTEINHYSEYVHVIESTDAYDYSKYIAIDYYGTNNRKVFYLYGIKHFMRAEIESMNVIIDDSNEIVKGDLSTYLSESVVNKGVAIKFADVTYRVMMKLSLALSSENLFINGLGFVKKESLEVEPIANTNLYSVGCQLLSTNKNFNSSANDQIGNDEGYSTLYIPRIVGANNKNIKII